jgi:1,4-alpha-glucan branching enzyme
VQLLTELNAFYISQPALYEHQFTHDGFEWIDIADETNSVLVWLRKGKKPGEELIFVANFTPMAHENYRIGVPKLGFYTEAFNTDAGRFGGSNCLNDGQLRTAPIPRHGRTHSLSLKLPPLGVTVLRFREAYAW